MASKPRDGQSQPEPAPRSLRGGQQASCMGATLRAAPGAAGREGAAELVVACARWQEEQGGFLLPKYQEPLAPAPGRFLIEVVCELNACEWKQPQQLSNAVKLQYTRSQKT